MGALKDGIDIAAYIGIPKKVIVLIVVGLVLLGGSVYATYYVTCAYMEHSANLEDLRQVLSLQQQMSSDIKTLKTDMNVRLTSSEEAINNLSIVTQRTSNDQMDILGDLVKYDATLRRIYQEKQKHITETQNDYLPHLNGFGIGITPKK
jgi:hypothetical protein